MGVVLISILSVVLITPPYGLVLLMASKFVGVRFSHALRAACPIYIVFCATIAFTIYFPSVVLWLPKHVLPASVGCFRNPSGVGYICPPGAGTELQSRRRSGVACRAVARGSFARLRPLGFGGSLLSLRERRLVGAVGA